MLSIDRYTIKVIFYIRETCTNFVSLFQNFLKKIPKSHLALIFPCQHIIVQKCFLSTQRRKRRMIHDTRSSIDKLFIDDLCNAGWTLMYSNLDSCLHRIYFKPQKKSKVTKKHFCAQALNVFLHFQKCWIFVKMSFMLQLCGRINRTLYLGISHLFLEVFGGGNSSCLSLTAS